MNKWQPISVLPTDERQISIPNIEIIFRGAGASLCPQAKAAILKKHYLKRMPPISWSFTGWCGDIVVAVITYGVPASRHLQISACPSNPQLVLELNRLWVADSMPRNTASQFIASSLRQIPPGIVVSYSDTREGHMGYVYRASNFHYAGWTDMERKTARFDYMPRNGNHSRDAFRTNDFDRVRRLPKVKYWIATGNRRDKRNLNKLAGWPMLDWKILPPPHSAHIMAKDVEREPPAQKPHGART